mmetsp:Transcript_38803/g.89592  ORF Transcript_38803/g.89592 Transcript_38803/m.89592 type:complete len:271 (-) Transcript_38803:108-920(-)
MGSPRVLFSKVFRSEADVRHTQRFHVLIFDFLPIKGIAAELLCLCLQLWITIVNCLLWRLLRIKVAIDTLLVSPHWIWLALMGTIATGGLSVLPMLITAPALTSPLNAKPLVVNASHGTLFIIHVDVLLHSQIPVVDFFCKTSHRGVVLDGEQVLIGVTRRSKSFGDLLSVVVRLIMIAIATMSIDAARQVMHCNEDVKMARKAVHSEPYAKWKHDVKALDGRMCASRSHNFCPVMVLHVQNSWNFKGRREAVDNLNAVPLDCAIQWLDH